MKVAAEWIAEFSKGKLSTDEVAQGLERAGVEVEGIIYGSSFDPGIVVGRVIDCTRHPQADKLKICHVDAGRGHQLEIVCGASAVNCRMAPR
jgi:phenylalanyl-tRNA synthetase beta chain